MTKRFLLALALATTLGQAALGADKTTSKNGDRMNITVKIGDRSMTATLNKSKTAQDFVSLLPLTLTMNDLFGREKFANLPRAVSTESARTHTYEVGDLAYWSPGSDLAIFYKHDGQKVPSPGLILIGKLDSGVEAFNVPGSVKVEIELANE